MIQLICPEKGGSSQLTIIELNLRDKLTSDFDTDNGLLIYLTSQQTGALIATTPLVNWGIDNERATRFFLYVSADGSNYAIGILHMGTAQYPLGFYDVSIFQNSEAGNYNSAGLNLLYNGLANVTASENASSPKYKEYGSTIVTGTQRVYLTLE